MLLDGKVAFITGAARGQGRSHAIRFAEEGANIIAMDLCDQIDSVAYPMARPEDLDETVNLVEKTGRRIVAAHGDVRNPKQIKDAVEAGVAEFGRLDFVLANAGIMAAIGESSVNMPAYNDSIDVLLNGVYYTIEAALPSLLAHGEGGAIVITSSVAGLKAFNYRNSGMAGYIAAKHGLVGLMRYFAITLADQNIRVNTVHPTGVNSPMVMNEVVGQYFAEQIAERPEAQGMMQNAMPVPWIECADISEAMVYLCSASGRFVTGICLPVDAGFMIR
jgi:SDR family mycofactocin-dependent oxidoreductase